MEKFTMLAEMVEALLAILRELVQKLMSNGRGQCSGGVVV
jgi:hypothetical protein